MNVLAIDTSAKVTRVCLLKAAGKGKGKILGRTEREFLTSADRQLSELVADCLDAGGIGKDEIDLVVVAIGPGSYTGLRSGLAFLKGFGEITGVDLKGVDLLDLLLWQNASDVKSVKRCKKIAAIDARVGRVYTKAGNGSKIEIRKLAEIVDSTKAPTQIIGDLPEEYVKELLRNPKLSVKQSQPTIDNLAQLGYELFKSKGPDDLLKLQPLYVQEPAISKRKKT